jgi:hypothetical protein
MGKRRPRIADHAEGQHGPETRARFVEQLHESPAKPPVAERIEMARRKGGEAGKRRLVEDRQQHDEAEKNSELRADRQTRRRDSLPTRRGPNRGS